MTLMSLTEPRLDALSIKMGAGHTEDELKALVDTHLGADWTLEAGHQVFDVLPPEDHALTTAEAWELAYQLRDQPEVEWAEPDFEVNYVVEDEQPEGDDDLEAVEVSPPELEALGGGDVPDNKVYDWAPKHIGALDVWDIPPKEGGRARGEGVVIGHPDSGYIEHTELGPRYLRERGYDFINKKPGARDKRGTHGLATASVMISPDNRNEIEASVTGAAPMASVIPYRVTKPRKVFWGVTIPAPVLFKVGARRLRKAVYRATIDDKCDVICICLGWLKNKALHEAIQFAVKQGVIVVAAAGNKTRGFVTYPGAYKETICLSGSTPENRPYKEISRGEEVDVSGPALGVYRAVPYKADQRRAKPSWGSSYATALTCGVAALWLAHHGGAEKLRNKYPGSKLQETFRKLLIQTAAVPPDWPSKKYGRGIIEAVRLIEADLPDDELEPMGVESTEAPEDGLAEIARLFDGVPADVIKQRLADRLGLAPGDRLEDRIKGFEDELLTRIMTDPDLYESLASASGEEAPELEGMGPAVEPIDGLSTRFSTSLR